MPRVRLSLYISMLALVAGTHVAAPAFAAPELIQIDQTLRSAFLPKIFLPDRPITDKDDHLETVKLIGSAGTCTGTIVSHHSVLTAAHCGCELGTGVKLYVGDPVDNRSVDVVDRTIHNLDCAKYQAASTAQKMDLLRVAGDVALLHTSRDLTSLGVAPANLHGTYSSGSTYYIVGYGRTNKLSSLPKWVGTIIGSDCGADASVLGCNSELEFKGVGKLVSVGGLSTDICEGDSGGPVFVSDISSPPKLTAVASRSYANAPADAACGHGSLYVRIDSLLATWVISNSR